MVVSHLRRAATSLLDCVLPEQCPVCAREIDNGTPLCPSCEHVVQPSTRVLANGLSVTSILPYSHRVADAITAMKYGNQPWRARAFGRLLAEQAYLLMAGRSPAPGTIAAPVPVSPDRARERGYNQAAIIAAAAAAAMSLRHEPGVLRRIDSLGSQTRATRSERITRPLRFEARRVTEPMVLIDDVLTTGATLMACADALWTAAGSAFPLTALTVAWTPDPTDTADHTRADSTGPTGLWTF